MDPQFLFGSRGAVGAASVKQKHKNQWGSLVQCRSDKNSDGTGRRGDGEHSMSADLDITARSPRATSPSSIAQRERELTTEARKHGGSRIEDPCINPKSLRESPCFRVSVVKILETRPREDPRALGNVVAAIGRQGFASAPPVSP